MIANLKSLPSEVRGEVKNNFRYGSFFLIRIMGKWGDVTWPSVTTFSSKPVELEDRNLAGIIIIVVAQNLPDFWYLVWKLRYLSSKLCSPYFFTLSFIAYNSSLLFVVQSKQWIEHVSSRLEGLGIFPRIKNNRLPGL